jgi:hypothetical protein
MAMRASAAAIGAAAAAPEQGETVTASGPAWSTTDVPGDIRAINAERDADSAVTALYAMHYRSLAVLAAMLVGDVSTAEEVVQDSFVALHASWRRLADDDRALSYLRRSVVNRCRSVPRRRMAADKAGPATTPGTRGQRCHRAGRPTPPGRPSRGRTRPCTSTLRPAPQPAAGQTRLASTGHPVDSNDPAPARPGTQAADPGGELGKRYPGHPRLSGLLDHARPPAGRRWQPGRSGPTPPALRSRRRQSRPALCRPPRSFWPLRPRC